MLIDLMAAMSHKDWLSRRQRQKQGIERAHTLGKYRGKQADQERHQKGKRQRNTVLTLIYW